MADRKRSEADRQKEADRQETDEVLGERGPPTGGGSAGGDLARRIGTEDELKRAYERPAGVTRVTKSDEKDEGS